MKPRKRKDNTKDLLKMLQGVVQSDPDQYMTDDQGLPIVVSVPPAEVKTNAVEERDLALDALKAFGMAGREGLGMLPVVGEMLDAAEIEHARRTGTDFYGGSASPELLAGLTAAGYLIPNMVERPAKAIMRKIGKLLPKKYFKSSIDWAAWNPDTPNHPELMEEYLDIERRTKADGTWMKNPDGTPFEGRPEQFVQQQSSYYKRAFPEGADKLYRGVGRSDIGVQSNFKDPDIDYDMEDVIFTSEQQSQAGSYAGGTQTITPTNIVGSRGGFFELLTPSNSKKVEIDTSGRDYLSVKANTSKEEAIAAVERSIADLYRRKNDYLNYISEGSTPPDIITTHLKKYDKKIEELRALEGDIEELYKTYDPAEGRAFWEGAVKKLRDEETFEGDDWIDTDDLADYLLDTDYDRLIMRNLDDEGIGNVNVIKNREGNYLKSAVGNVGFFDLTNPDVFKAMIPILGIGTAVAVRNKQQEIKQS